MQGLIFDIKHYAIHDGPGIRQTIFFKGCPLSCWWCHNPESQSPCIETYTKKRKLDNRTFQREETVGYSIDVQELLQTIQSDRVFFEESGGGVTFSGGEPLMQPGFLHEIAAACKRSKIHTALDTSGYASREVIEHIMPNIDLFLFDLKIIDDSMHKKYTGVSNKTIKDNLDFLASNKKNIRLRFPLIPGITNSTENLKDIKAYLQNLKNITHIDILPYHNISSGKYTRFEKNNKMNDTTLLPGEAERIKSEFETLGYQVKIGG